MTSLFDRNGNLIAETDLKESYVTNTKEHVIPITRPLANIIVYDDTSGIFIVREAVKVVEVYNNRSEHLKYIFEGRFVSVDWGMEISAARSKRITVQLLNHGNLIDYETGLRVYDWDYILLIKKIPLIKTS